MNWNIAFIFALSFALGVHLLLPFRNNSEVQSATAPGFGGLRFIQNTVSGCRERAVSLIQASAVPGLKLRTLVMISIIAAAFGALVVLVITTIPMLAIISGVLAASAPWIFLRSRARRLVQQRRALWPNVCELLLASVRSGASLGEAVSALSQSAPEALRQDFARFERDYLASGHFDSSIVRLRNSLADATADRILETLRVSRSLGGVDLPQVLAALAKSVRAQVNVREEVRARQSWVRGTAVLGLVAPWVIMAMLVLRPEGVAAYSSAMGVVMLLVGLVVSIAAYVLMIRLGTLPDEKRWHSFLAEGANSVR